MINDYASSVAMLSFISTVVPLIVGLFSIRYLSKFYKCVLASITVSLVFDAYSFLRNILGWFSLSISNYYDFFAIFFWGAAFAIVLKENKLKSKYPVVLIALTLLLSLYLGITNSGVISVAHPNATLGSLFILAGSTLLVMYFLIAKPEIKKPDLPVIAILCANIVYYATVTSIFIFFASIAQEQVMTLYLIKWVLYILLNMIFAFIFYKVRAREWA